MSYFSYFFRVEQNIVEVLLLSLMFAFKHERRKYYAVRLVVGIAAVIAFCALFSFLYMLSKNTIVYIPVKIVTYILCNTFAATAMLLCYKDSFSELISCGLSAVAAHSVTSGLRELFYPGINLFYWIPNSYLRSFTYQLSIYVVSFPVYVIIWLVFVKKSFRIGNSNRLEFIILSLIALFATSALSGTIPLYKDESKALMIVGTVFSVLCGFLILFLKKLLASKAVTDRELAVAERLNYLEQKQYAMLKSNMDLINVKCHDLKHRLRDIEGRIDEEEMKELKNAVGFFDGIFSTENETLDAILNEKNFTCLQKGISFTCFGSAKCLSFMSDGDLYSLFGNALDNAIESVGKIADGDKRCINLKIERNGSSAVVDIMNYFDGEIVVKNGGISTSKKDKDYHGFGIMSMRMTAQKYNGKLDISAADGIFRLIATFPIE